jgi:hypothetical protein
MAQNQPLDLTTVELESGPQTVAAIQTLWLSLNNGIIEQQRSSQIARDIFEPKVLTTAPVANTDNLSITGVSVVHFNGATSFNLTGLVAPETNKARLVIIHVSGAGTVTLKHLTTSTAVNQLSLITGADTPLTTRHSAVFIYLSSFWRQIV